MHNSLSRVEGRLRFIDFNGTAFPAALAFVSAYVEAACFIGLHSLFTSFVTGNMVLIGAELAKQDDNIATKLLVLPIFAAACGVWSAVLRTRPRPSRAVIRACLLLEGSLLLLTLVLAIALSPISPAESVAILIVATPTVFASALQIVMMRHQLVKHPHTTIMTGNMATFMGGIVEALFYRFAGTGEPDRGEAENRSTTMRLCYVVFAFLAGAAMGGFGFILIGFWCLLLPIAMLLVLGLRGGFSEQGPSHAKGHSVSRGASESPGSPALRRTAGDKSRYAATFTSCRQS